MLKQTKKAVAILLSLCMCFSLVTPAAFATEEEFATREYVVSEFVRSVGRGSLEKSDAVLSVFDDADKVSPEYKDDISRAIVAGILKGYQDHTIRPTDKIYRVEALVMLARCVPELEAASDAIEFTDVPDWAKEDISYLTKAGLVKGYGDGTMGAEDYITVEQVGLLVERCDEALRTVAPGDSFYGYVNEKTFRNAVLEDTTEIDPIHGAVITKSNSWSHFSDVYEEIVEEENEILEKLVNGELEYEDGSVEQRIIDMLKCLDSKSDVTESDKKNITDMRSAILGAKNVDELLDVAKDIYKLAGINVLFDIAIDNDDETGVPYPTFSIATSGEGGLIAYRESTDTDEYRDVYAMLVSNYLDSIGADFTDKDIDDAIELQELSSKDSNHFSAILTYLTFAQLFGVITDEELEAEVEAMIKAHPEVYDEESESVVDPTSYFVTKPRAAADNTFTGFDLCAELEGYGFTNIDKIIVPSDTVAASEKNIISDKNLNSLKINALLVLNTNLGVSLNDEELKANNYISTFPIMLCFSKTAQELNEGYTVGSDGDDQAEESFEENTGMELDEGLLSAVNLTNLNRLMPNDVGLLHCKYYYNDEVTDVVCQMFDDIWDAYENRFKANTWMAEETKKNAIAKLDNMLAVIAYPDNYTFPEIVPISEGGTLFSNTLSIMRNNLADLIRANTDKEFSRTIMFMPPDMVNACYIPTYNTINVPAGILNAPFYDEEASYAANLGSIGMIIAHEIGHAFDKSGALYDENGCQVNWWTDKDYAEFQKIQNHFIEYYNQFEVTEGVVQDSEITIGENMADFAAMQILMDILGDDKVAQQECFEAYARMWAQLGTVAYLTDSSMLNDVHAANVVRVNAVVASFPQFYDIYGVQEGDAMYVAPENRLRLW